MLSSTCTAYRIDGASCSRRRTQRIHPGTRLSQRVSSAVVSWTGCQATELVVAQAFEMNKPSADLYAGMLKPDDPILKEDVDRKEDYVYEATLASKIDSSRKSNLGTVIDKFAVNYFEVLTRLSLATGPWLGSLPCEQRVDRALNGPFLGMFVVAHPSWWGYRAAQFNSAPPARASNPGTVSAARRWLMGVAPARERAASS